MSSNRDKVRDKATTRLLILDPNRPPYAGGENWLGHGSRGGRDAVIDYLLLDGATMKRLLEERGTENSIRSHFQSLKTDHDLPVVGDADGIYRFDRLHLGIEPSLSPSAVAVTGVPAPSTRTAPAADVSAAEGRELLRLHRLRERNRALVTRKKREVLSAFGRLSCEACDFDFKAVYGPRGDGFAECHHTHPISQSAPGRRTHLSELAVVCANCHRMLHRRPWVSVPELRELVQSQGRKGGRVP